MACEYKVNKNWLYQTFRIMRCLIKVYKVQCVFNNIPKNNLELQAHFLHHAF